MLHRALAAWAVFHELRSLLALNESALGEIVDEHVVELLGQLQDATEDIHSVAICNG